MYERAAPSPVDQELRELRVRAYGPEADIQDDPEALARLAELEAARLVEHAAPGVGEYGSQELDQVAPQSAIAFEAPAPAAVVPGAVVLSGEPAGRSLWQRVIATPAGRVGLIAGCAVVVLGAWYATSWGAAPNLEATLQPTGVEADALVLGAVSFAPLAEVDTSTLRGYEAYRHLEPWVSENAQGSRCLMAIQGGTLHGIRCAPPEAELMIDLGAYPLDYTATYMQGLADGSVIRFQLDGDTVAAYLFTPPSAD